LTELADYSGEFNPDIGFADFSKDFLLSALGVYGEYAYIIDAFWYLGVKEKRGAEEASSHNRRTLEKSVLYEIDKARQIYKIHENDVSGLFKFMQMRPMSRILIASYELKAPNLGIYTVTNCPVLENMEREGRGREQIVCHVDHAEGAALVAKLFNPEMKGRPLRLPPRKSKDELPCQWEFRLDV